ncbi:hypothetical protein D9M71_805420 [compost metagenome]
MQQSPTGAVKGNVHAAEGGGGGIGQCPAIGGAGDVADLRITAVPFGERLQFLAVASGHHDGGAFLNKAPDDGLAHVVAPGGADDYRAFTL